MKRVLVFLAVFGAFLMLVPSAARAQDPAQAAQAQSADAAPALPPLDANDPLRLAPPDAFVLAGLDWKGLLNTTAGKAIEQQMQQGLASTGMPLKGGAIDWLKLLFGQVDSVVLAMPTNLPDDRKGGVPLVIVRGDFKVADLRARTAKTGKPELYRSVELFRSKGADSPYYRVAYPDVHTIVMGDRKFVHGAIDRWYQASSVEANEVMIRARTIRKAGQFWIAATMTDEFAADMKENAAAAALLKELVTVDGVIGLQNGFALAMNLGAKDPASAEKLTAIVKSAVALMGPGQDPETAALMKKLEITRETSLVKIGLALSENEVAQLAAKRGTPGAAPGSTLARRSAPAAPPLRDNKVRIYGLEDGVVEFPLRPEEKQ